MARTMALTVAAVVCGGLVGFAATSYATSLGDPAGVPGALAGSPASSERDGQEHDHEHHGPHAHHGGALLHGESVLEDPDTGEFVTWAHQQGEVTEKSDGGVTVESADGTAWEWTITDDTAIHGEDGSVKVGDSVMVGGVREGEVRTAHHLGGPLPDHEEIREGMEGLLDGLELPDLDLDLDLPHHGGSHGEGGHSQAALPS